MTWLKCGDIYNINIHWAQLRQRQSDGGVNVGWIRGDRSCIWSPWRWQTPPLHADELSSIEPWSVPLFRKDQDLRVRRTEGAVLQKDGGQRGQSPINDNNNSSFRFSEKHKLLQGLKSSDVHSEGPLRPAGEGHVIHRGSQLCWLANFTWCKWCNYLGNRPESKLLNCMFW